MPVPTLEAEEYQYEDMGILLNGDAVLPFVDVKKVSGLDSTDLRQSSRDREGLHGGYLDAKYEGMRPIILEGTLYADTTNMETFLDDLKANYAPSSDARPFYFGTDAGTRAVFGKALGFKYDKDQMRRLGAAEFQTQIICEDPRIYTPTLVDAEVVLGAVTATGRGYPKSYPYGYGPAVTTQQAVLTLGGNREQPGTITMYGPITNPVITYQELGITMTLALTIGVGEYVTINLANRTVRSSAGANIRGKLSLSGGGWFLLSPGQNTFGFSGSSTSAGVTKLVVEAYEAAWR